MIKASSYIFLYCLSALLFHSCKNASGESSNLENQKTTPTQKKITYFSLLVDTTFTIESKNDSIQNIQDLYFEIDEENPEGIFTFRGGNQRNSPVRGSLSFQPKKIALSWSFQTSTDTLNGPFGYWGGGAGWTGQPLVVNWSKSEIAQLSNLNPTFLSKNELKEIIRIQALSIEHEK
jgi:hypothetical protein